MFANRSNIKENFKFLYMSYRGPVFNMLNYTDSCILSFHWELHLRTCCSVLKTVQHLFESFCWVLGHQKKGNFWMLFEMLVEFYAIYQDLSFEQMHTHANNSKCLCSLCGWNVASMSIFYSPQLWHLSTLMSYCGL